MLSCRQAAELAASEDLDKLPWHRRMGIRLHLRMCSCPTCGAFAKQLMMFREMAHKFQQRQESELDASDTTLPEEAKERIVERLKQ